MISALRGAATGVGSWPGVDVREALAVIRGELPDLPHLPELPARGPGADLIGRGAALLTELPVDLQPHGWRLVERPGRDSARATAYLRQDLDELAEAFEGYAGPLKVAVCGPWTLAGSLWLARGERAITDPGARRDLAASLADGVRVHLDRLHALVPDAEFVLQIDEPGLPAAMQGRLPTASGYGTVRSVEDMEAETGLATVIAAATAAGATTVVHCCAPDLPLGLLRRAGAAAVSLDLSLLGSAGWEELGEQLDAGLGLYAGVVPTGTTAVQDLPRASALADAVREPWRRLGLPLGALADVVVTPTCGLASSSPALATATLRRAVEGGRALAELAHGG